MPGRRPPAGGGPTQWTTSLSTSYATMTHERTTARHRIVAPLLLLLATQADAMVLCATRKGDIVADEHCRKREVQLEARDLGVVGPAGLPGTDGPAGPEGANIERPFRLVDANGKTVCTSLASDGLLVQCILEIDPESAPVQLVLLGDGTDKDRPYVYHDAPGCQGTPLTYESAAVIDRGTLLGTRLFVPNGTHSMIEARSSEQVRDTCDNGTVTPHGTCCVDHDPALQLTLAPAHPVDLSTLGLTAPLHREDR